MPNSDSQRRWTWSRDDLIPSCLATGRCVVEDILGQLKRRSWLRHDIFGVHLALEEALVNAITHGNRSDSSKNVHMACRMADDFLQVRITDEGSGFDPSALPDPTDPGHIESPTGRGVMLMRNFMSRVEYNARGNQVILEKQRALVD